MKPLARQPLVRPVFFESEFAGKRRKGWEFIWNNHHRPAFFRIFVIIPQKRITLSAVERIFKGAIVRRLRKTGRLTGKGVRTLSPRGRDHHPVARHKILSELRYFLMLFFAHCIFQKSNSFSLSANRVKW